MSILSARHLVLIDALCAILSNAFPHCGNRQAAFAPNTLPVYRMNNTAFAGEACMWGPHGRICAHETTCSRAEYAKGVVCDLEK